MRIALIDLLFSWPPHGGADVDVFYGMRELCRLGYDARLFFTREASGWERGQAEAASLPFPATRLDFPAPGLTAPALTARVQDVMEQYRPDAILLTQGYFLKVPLIHGLAAYPLISRCYAHEIACHKDILRFRDNIPCTHSYAKNPEVCRRCALGHQGAAISGEHATAWTREYLAAKAWSARYYDLFLRAMGQLRGVIITTERMREQVQGLCRNIHVIPHGVDCERFTPPPNPPDAERPILFVPGRVEDPAKGFDVVMAAATLLVQEGFDFEVRATLSEGHPGPSWLKATGKLDYDTMPQAYREADICIIPSIWEEPFGIVALEAMASGLPVCATRIGGLQDIVADHTTGLLFERGNAAALAACLKPLLRDTELRRLLGKAGRERVLERYQWKNLVETHYPRLFENL